MANSLSFDHGIVGKGVLMGRAYLSEAKHSVMVHHVTTPGYILDILLTSLTPGPAAFIVYGFHVCHYETVVI